MDGVNDLGADIVAEIKFDSGKGSKPDTSTGRRWLPVKRTVL